MVVLLTDIRKLGEKETCGRKRGYASVGAEFEVAQVIAVLALNS